MGRMKGSSGGGEVNPLQRMLGTYLRLERIRLGYSSAEVARRLGLTDTYFRLAESGRAALNQSLVFKIIEVFAASNTPTHDNRTISFSRFALYLVGTHWVGAEMASQKSQGSAAKRGFEALAALVSDFQILYERTGAYFDLEEGDAQKHFLENVAAPEVGIFLRSEAYDNPENTNKELLRVDELPTLNIDILLDLKRSLTGRSFVHTYEIAAKWESERATQFRYFRAVFKDPGLVLNQGNLDIFHYEYLHQRLFLEGRFIFIDSEKNETDLKNEFVKLQNIGRKKAPPDLGLKPLTGDEIDKIKFICLNSDERERYKSELEELLCRDGRVHEAYWAFETHLGLQVAFIGVCDENLENIRNLVLRDANKKLADFSMLWNDIKCAHGLK